LPRSAWSLGAVCRWSRRVLHKEAPVVWFPDYFCNSSLADVRRCGGTVVFYPVTEQLAPCWDLCKELAERTPPDIFLLTHYFGAPAPASQARQFCDRHRALLVEDAAHVLLPVEGIGEKGDIVLYSPHKLLPVPEGALMVLRPSMQTGGATGADPLGAMAEIVAEALPPVFPLRFLVKRTLRKLLPGALFGARLPDFDNDFSAAPEPPRLMHPASLRMLAQVCRRLAEVRRSRLCNGDLWRHLLANRQDLVPLVPKDKERVPYLLPFKAASGETCRRLCHELRAAGVAAQSWPDLPPEVVAAGARHAAARTLRDTVLTLPVHQSLPVASLAALAGRAPFGAAQRAETVCPCTLLPFGEGAKQWNQLMVAAGRSNLLQAWHYGEAKAKVEGWRSERFLVQINGRTVAFFQALIRVLGPVRIVRINRGPLWLEKELPQATLLQVLSLLRRTWNLCNGSLLLFAPALSNASDLLLLLLQQGFSTRGGGWTSGWLDLKQSDETLRKQLNGKWRNQLVTAEKAGLSFETDGGDGAFEWLLERYRQAMLDKKFCGVPEAVLRAIRAGVDGDGEFLVLRAFAAEEPVAGIIVAIHGAACTYLVGWNGDHGRKVNALNFLLWQSLLHVKQRGVESFDVGGIDDFGTPDVARFKKNMNGEGYELLGEFW